MHSSAFLATCRVLARSSPEHPENFSRAYEDMHAFLCDTEARATLDPQHVKWCVDILFDSTAHAHVAASGFATQLIVGEINCGPEFRFSTETIVSWMNKCNARGWNEQLKILVDACDRKNLALAPEQVITWAMKCLQLDGSMKIGSLLLLRSDCVQSPQLDLWYIGTLAGNAAQSGNHAVTRLFPLLLENWLNKKRRVLTGKQLDCLAEIIAKANHADREMFVPEILFKCAESHLGPKTFQKLVQISDEKITAHEEYIMRTVCERRKAFKALYA